IPRRISLSDLHVLHRQAHRRVGQGGTGELLGRPGPVRGLQGSARDRPVGCTRRPPRSALRPLHGPAQDDRGERRACRVPAGRRHPQGGEPRQLVLSDPPDRDPFDDPQWDGEPFEDELDEEPEPAPPEPPHHGGGKLAGLVMAAAIVAAYAWTGPRAGQGAAFRAGSADAGRILSGEVWRGATALTLHADLSHLVANATAGAFLATAVCRIVGGGLGAFLIVVAGVAGNLF